MNEIRAVIEWIESNPLLDFLIIFLIPTIFEVSKIKINPWTWLGRKIGLAINHDVINRLDEVDSRLDTLEKQQAETNEKNELKEAEDARTRILRTADDIRIEARHSKEFFDDVLRDCGKYEKYCADHERYPNHKAEASIKLINETYERCLRENSFL